jgi:hypothetical protein
MATAANEADGEARIRVSPGRIGLMLTAFLMLGLIGVFATYAGPIPAMRGVIAERALVRAAASGDRAAIRAAVAAARPLLGVSAQKSLDALPATRDGAGRAASLLAEGSARASALIGFRLRLLIAVMGVLCALFGVALLGIREAPSASPQRRRPASSAAASSAPASSAKESQ